MRVELLYFNGCPGYEELLPRVRQLIGDRPDIKLRAVESPEEAERLHFLGSPTLRVNGRDVDPDAGERTDYGMKCRLYRTPEGQFHAPPDEWVRQALEGAG